MLRGRSAPKYHKKKPKMLQRSLSLIISRQTMSFQSQSCSVSFWQYILLVPFLAISIFSQSLVTCMSAFMSSSFIAD